MSAYQHVKSQHELPVGGTSLSVPDLTRLADNLKGYDISPEMTKLAMANMYLHTQDKNPNIDNYDTLTSTDHWNEYADVMLANPPFMTPKGGIRPHSRFRVAAKRAEVLFVDYIASHLNEHGRAGIIVPEGIIFQSQNAYRQLRRILLDESLVAVISLPGGVFNPYSGVKTSILILDKVLAPKTDYVAFFKVGNDGYDLGAQRRPIGQDDLPAVSDEINEYLRRLRKDESLEDYQSTLGHVVAKSDITADGDCNLSGERYNTRTVHVSQHVKVKLGEPGLFEIVSGGTPKSGESEYWDGGIPWITLTDLPAGNFISEIETTERTISDAGLAHSAAKIIPANSVVVSSRATIGRVGINRIPLATNQGFKNIVIEDTGRAIAKYVALAVTRLVPEMQEKASGATFPEITKTKFAELEIPLPPLEVQCELVAEIESYQRVIDGARAVLDNYRPRIAVDPEWPAIHIGAVAFFQEGPGIRSYEYQDGGYPIINVRCVRDGHIDLNDSKAVDSELVKQKWSHFSVEAGDILFTTSGTIGRVAIANPEHLPLLMNTSVVRFRTLDASILCNAFLYQYLRSDYFVERLKSLATGSAQLNCGPSHIKTMQISLPPLETQQAIVAEIEVEQALVLSNSELVERMEQRIQDVIARVWEG